MDSQIFLVIVMVVMVILVYFDDKIRMKNPNKYLSKLQDLLNTMDVSKEIQQIKDLHKQEPYNTFEKRKKIGYQYDNLYDNLNKYISKEEYKKHLNIMENIILSLKDYFNLARPASIDPTIEDVYLASAQTPSYPSGHSTQYHYFYLLLKDREGIDAKELKEVTEMGGISRIVAGVHYPIDHKAGKLLAEMIYKNSYNI